MADGEQVEGRTRLRIYETMSKIHQVDERVRGLLMSGKIAIIYYSPRGQESIPSAVSAAMESDDYTVTTYRGVHDSISSGASLDEILAEMLGKATGTSKGKGGPMHLSDPNSGLMVTTGIVGGGLPIANGIALASRMKGLNRVTVCYFGDGSTNIGAFHEALNLAAVWDLPVVFVCQNNEYGEYTPRRETQRVEKISTRAASYGIPGVTVDGNDPDATYLVAREAVARARDGGGPTLIEAMTYRFMGHMFGDQMPYMPSDEMAARVAEDPVPKYRALLIAEGAATSAQLDEIDQRLSAEIDQAVERALAAPMPAAGELFTDVYGEVPA
ncbi:thiamine pyrophosphate-dependent dehydrogenase E1 component subunit alpha [Pseudonocardia spinosispora]|uniref:thiamine pyrophosphate-dependent dehydrogenase E1 component subunit alpha n=1 Tax=Pseudonocardia spinosispora TaxID=103441 RepID=UPI000429EC65|nr:thiamine pyrophosphate-dependent dehydrogenase E1 component subunit alpha [Pseudonocardia spinosispora]